MTYAVPPDRRTVLIVDDEPKIRRLIHRTFTDDGYEVLQAADGEEGLAMAESERPNLILLDLSMPRLDGIAACRRIRELSNVPIIMLTAQSADADRIAGLDVGADDYVVKPFSPGELLARVRALLRRTATEARSLGPVYDDGTLTIDLEHRQVTLAGEPVRLSRIEFRLIEVLAGHPGQVFMHDQLLDRVWGEEYSASLEQLRTYVKYVRRKIEPDPAVPRYVLAQRGVGYTFRSRMQRPS